ncbi:MAG: M48 family metallopeptidase [Bradymonadaceae bacterium]
MNPSSRSIRPRVIWLWMSVLLIGAPLLGTGCPVRPARAAADILLPPREEVMLGNQISQEIEEELTLHPDPNVQDYVSAVGKQIVARVEDRPEAIDFTFRVIDDLTTVNAFAIPGGWIYVYSGLMQAMDSEAELAAVLAHEIAHVTRRHLAQRLVAMYGLDVLTQVALGQDPGMLATIVATIVGQGALLRYSRDQERDADDFGLHYAVNAGYDPRGFLEFFGKLAGRPSPPDFLLTHPSPEARIERLESQIEELEEIPTRREQERFEAIKALL